MGDILSYKNEDGIAVIKMDDGKANALSPTMIGLINDALDKAESEGAVVVLTGRDGLFSGGYDLKVMMSGPKAAIDLVDQGGALTSRLLSFPTPVIAAASGHAIAKGAFILLACDYRIGLTEGTKTGLNETQIGMTMHHYGIGLAKERIAPTWLNRSLVNGEIFGPQDAVKAGFLDVLVPADKLMDTAMKTAKAMQELNMRAFAGTKLKSRKAFLEHLKWARAEDRKMSVLQ